MGTALSVLAKEELQQAPGWLVVVMMTGVLVAGAFYALVIVWGIAYRRGRR